MVGSESLLTSKLPKHTSKAPLTTPVGRRREIPPNALERRDPPPPAQVLDSGKNITLPSRDPGRQIPCRVFEPASGKPKGVFYHIHGGGWVLQSEAYQDIMLKYYADYCQTTVVSVGYRLAPEHPYPAGNEDCFDIGEYLIDNAEKDFGAPLLFMGGDSAGGHLSVVTCFHLLTSRPNFAFKGLILNFGAYDLSGFLPQAHNFKLPLVLDVEIMTHFTAAYLPGSTVESRRDPKISPFFAEMEDMKLPPALFTCGTRDCLLDDSVMMHAKWAMSGAESILKIYPGECHVSRLRGLSAENDLGAPHGFVFFPPGQTETTQAALDDIVAFCSERS